MHHPSFLIGFGSSALLAAVGTKRIQDGRNELIENLGGEQYESNLKGLHAMIPPSVPPTFGFARAGREAWGNLLDEYPMVDRAKESWSRGVMSVVNKVSSMLQ
ncbi:unnamed protein product [Chrysoparadoxa australica]